MAQNVYDDEGFFAAYGRLPRSIDGLEAAPEWPTLQSMLPSMPGLRVVDLGCGYGWFCRWAIEAGAALVLGLDVSERMLGRARADGGDPRITYRRSDLDEIELDTGAFDLAYSSLTLHYLVDIDRLFAQIAQSLSTGGRFVFSCEHPILTAPSAQGFIDGPNGRVWALDQYQAEGPRVTNWLADGVLKQHRTITTYFAALRRAGFEVTDLVEWRPSDDELAVHPDWAAELDRPMFLLVGTTLR
jgi:SAM-dependent methyltransferase